MSDFIDARLEPALWLGCDWSLRWALLIAVVAAWLALRPPRSAAVRLAVCQLAFVTGLALPLVPHWWGHRFLPAHDNFLPAHDDADVARPPRAVAADPIDASLGKAAARTVVVNTTLPSQRAASAPRIGEPANDSLPRERSSAPPERTAQPLGAWRITVLAAAGFWAVGAGVQLLRLLAASIWLKLLCRKTELPSSQSRELFDRCRQELRLRRKVRLGVHPGVSTPLVVGGRRATVLVPADWDGVAPEAQRAVLWHELAHLARFDDLTKAAEEFVRALFFFHPLVHWLLNRIESYREEVCDAAVLRRGVSGPTLAEILVDFSRRHAAARDASMKPALPFFQRGSVKRRIDELLEEKTVVGWSAPLSRRQVASLGLIAAMTLAGVGSFGLEAALSPGPGPTPREKSAEPVAAGLKTAAQSPTLKRILANWTARQDRTKSLHLAWDSQIAPPRGETLEGQQLTRVLRALSTARVEVRDLSTAVELHSPLPDGKQPDQELAKARERFKEAQSEYELAKKNLARPKVHPPFRVLHNELWFDGDQRIRIEQSFTRGRGYRYLRDGMTKSTWVWSSESGDPPKAKIWSDEIRPDFEAFGFDIDSNLQGLWPGATTPRMRTPWMIFRPFDLEGWRPEAFRLIAEDAVVGNVHYVKIARIAANPNLSETYYVDPARDDVIVFGEEFFEFAVRYERPINPQLFAFEIEYQHDRDWSWVPVRWKLKSPRYRYDASEASVNTVTGLTINETLPAETFALNFAPRTVVFDRRTREQSVIADDGSKTSVRRFDSDKSLRIQELLDSRTDFTIEPEPLRDALDFIAARYEIAIRIDEKAIEQKKIATTVEVRCNESGIKLRELLRKLLRQVDKSVDFKIENGSLSFKIENGVLRIAPEPNFISIETAPKPVPSPKEKNSAE